jgi:hypothetical protein
VNRIEAGVAVDGGGNDDCCPPADANNTHRATALGTDGGHRRDAASVDVEHERRLVGDD